MKLIILQISVICCQIYFCFKIFFRDWFIQKYLLHAGNWRVGLVDQKSLHLTIPTLYVRIINSNCTNLLFQKSKAKKVEPTINKFTFNKDRKACDQRPFPHSIQSIWKFHRFLLSELNENSQKHKRVIESKNCLQVCYNPWPSVLFLNDI